MQVKTRWGLLFLFFYCAGFLLIQSYTKRMGPWVELMDIWEHMASIGEMAKNPTALQNPLLLLDYKTSPRFTPYIALLALFTRTLYLHPKTVLYMVSFFNLFLFVLSLYLFVKAYAKDDVAPVFALFFMLSLWGEGWRYASEYCLVSFIYYLSYPASVSFSISLLTLFLLQRLIKKRNVAGAMSYIVLCAFVFTTHPLTGSFLVLTSVVLLMIERAGRWPWGVFICACLGTLTACILWPYSKFFQLIRHALLGPPWYETAGYLHSMILRKAGPAFILVPVLVFFLLRKKFVFLLAGFCTCAGVYIVSQSLGVVLLERYIYFVLFFLHVAGGVFVSWALKQKGRTYRWGAMGITSVALVCLGYQSIKLGLELSGRYIDYGTVFGIKSYEDPINALIHLEKHMQEGSVVLSDTVTSWTLPGLFHVKVVSLLHNSPLVFDNSERKKAVAMFFSPKTGNRTRRTILRRYHVGYILLNTLPLPWQTSPRVSPSVGSDLKKFGEVVYEDRDLLFVKVSR